MRGFLSRRRLVTVVALALVALAVAAAVGRWERQRNAGAQNREMAVVYRLATSDGLISPRLHFYRLFYEFDCLVYGQAGRPVAVSAYELCFDPQGRLVETIDRRTSTPVFGTLRTDPSLATLTVPVPRLLAALRALGAAKDDRLAGVSLHGSELPVGFPDRGALAYARVRSGS